MLIKDLRGGAVGPRPVDGGAIGKRQIWANLYSAEKPTRRGRWRRASDGDGWHRRSYCSTCISSVKNNVNYNFKKLAHVVEAAELTVLMVQDQEAAEAVALLRVRYDCPLAPCLD